MKRIVWAIIAVAVPALALAPASAAEQSFKTNVSGTVHNQCAPEEDVNYSGVVKTTTQSHPNASGTHVTMHMNNQGVKGVGVTSGDRYSIPGQTHESMNVNRKSSTETKLVRMKLVRHGAEADMTMVMRTHIPTNALGNVTAMKVVPETVECHGTAAANSHEPKGKMKGRLRLR